MSERSPHEDNSRRTFLQSAALAGAGLMVPTSGAAADMTAQGTAPRAATAGARFRQLLAGPDLVQCPVIYDVATARLSEIMGFPTVFAGGQPAANGMYRIGDYGNISITELIEFARRIADNVDIPIMADGDDGGGNPLNVHRTVKNYEKAGVGCLMIEDMYGAKYIPGAPPGPLTSKQGFVDKIRAAVDARKGDLVILARSDALLAKESFEQGLDRLVAYLRGGRRRGLPAGERDERLASYRRGHQETTDVGGDAGESGWSAFRAYRERGKDRVLFDPVHDGRPRRGVPRPAGHQAVRHDSELHRARAAAEGHGADHSCQRSQRNREEVQRYFAMTFRASAARTRPDQSHTLGVFVLDVSHLAGAMV